MTNTNTFCFISISNLKTGRFETRRFETWRFVNLTFCKPDVLKPDVLKPDVLKPDVLKPDVLWVYRLSPLQLVPVHVVCLPCVVPNIHHLALLLIELHPPGSCPLTQFVQCFLHPGLSFRGGGLIRIGAGSTVDTNPDPTKWCRSKRIRTRNTVVDIDDNWLPIVW